MAVNRVSITINSRQYTVVAEESREYIERLGEHINEKVKNVLNGGQNVLGERPIVLAALNICDEYFKALESDDSVKVEIEKLNSKIDNLKKENDSIKRELDDAKSGQVTIDETKPVPERVAEFIRQIQNPYCFRIGDVVIKVVYKENGPSFQQNMIDMLQTV